MTISNEKWGLHRNRGDRGLGIGMKIPSFGLAEIRGCALGLGWRSMLVWQEAEEKVTLASYLGSIGWNSAFMHLGFFHLIISGYTICRRRDSSYLQLVS
jgi:hypothetical protein